jgi:hypothetical protein
VLGIGSFADVVRGIRWLPWGVYLPWEHWMVNHLSFDMLSKVVEGRASTVEEPKARRHLASCGRCRSELEWLQRIQGRPVDRVGSEMGGVEFGGVY